MIPGTRREFLNGVGRSMLFAGLGTALAEELGFCASAFADSGPERLAFGEYDALVDLLQATPPEKIQSLLVEKLRRGEVDLRTLVAAGALANAETFGGQDYVGFHTAMAFIPALSLSALLPEERRPLPVLKVLYRNSQQTKRLGGASKTTLLAMHEAEHGTSGDVGDELRDAARKADMNRAERLFASTANAPLAAAFDALQPVVQDDVDVHRFVLAHRVHGLASLLGKKYAHDLLRQCVRFCVEAEDGRLSNNRPAPPIRTVLPKLLDQYKLAGMPSTGKRDPGDAWVDATSKAIYAGPPERAAETVAAALSEGIDPEVVGEAISLASNLLVLRQGSSPRRTHGASAGVHSSDATNAWRNMARSIDTRFAVTGLIIAAYHSAAHDPFASEPYPTDEQRAAIRATTPAALLDEAADAVRNNDQGRAAAAIRIYDERGFPADAVFERMLAFTVSEDGRLHGEKYFQTVQEEYRTIRPAFRGRQLVGLARVTASAYGYDLSDKSGYRAPGYEEACRLLGVTA